MTITRIALGAVIAASSLASVAAADIRPNSEPITFIYDLDVTRLDNEAGARDVYADLSFQARRACEVSGRPGLTVVDAACVAELVEKVVAAASSSQLQAQHDGAVRAVQADAVPTGLLASVR